LASEKTLEMLKKNNMNIKQTARLIKCSKNTLKEIRKRDQLGLSLDNRSTKPHRHANQTSVEIEEKIKKEWQKTRFGRVRMHKHLKENLQMEISTMTIRNIYRRNQKDKPPRVRGEYRSISYYDFDQIKPLENWQFDTKEIPDIKALPKEVYAHIFKNRLPIYQWTAIDPKVKLKFLAYSINKTFTNGLAFMLLVWMWLRVFGIDYKLFFQFDGGVEFPGPTLEKLAQMQEKLFKHLNVQLLRTRKNHPEDNGFVERTHRTDDEEFYVSHLLKFDSLPSFMFGAQKHQLFFNTKRWHYGREMNGLTPQQKLKQLMPKANPKICAFPVLLLDPISSDKLFTSGGQHVLDYYPVAISSGEFHFQ
jgi:hypothetical protein